MGNLDEIQSKNAISNIKQFLILTSCLCAVGLVLYSFIYWHQNKSFFFFDLFKSRSEYQVVTDLKATQEADSIVTALEGNVEEGESTVESDNFSPLAYGDVVYSYGDEGEIVLGTFTLMGTYRGFNESTQEIIIKLAESEEILAFSQEDISTMYFFTSDVTEGIEVSSGGVSISPNSSFPLSVEERQNYKVESAKEIPQNTITLIYGQVDYTQEKNITYDSVEFYVL